MQPNLINEEVLKDLSAVNFLVGSKELLENVQSVPARKPFDEEILEFLNDVSKGIMKNPLAKAYPDVITWGFWVRKSSINSLKKRFENEDNYVIGRGLAFHIAPSNVPVNYAYSLVTGLVTGNVNIVRIPSKDFPQVTIINKVINETLESYPEVARYIFLVRYNRSQRINDIFSSIADTRIVWGGDNTIAELRKSPLPPRAGEITFADRYSLAVIDSDKYLSLENKGRFADDFYNDTFLSDQNACTSPRIIVWTGKDKEEAKNEFWSNLHELVAKKYNYQSIMGVNKLTSAYILAANKSGVHILPHEDNLIVRVKLDQVDDSIMNFRDNSGYFFEYDCEDILNIRDVVNNTHCQTLGFLGDKEDILPLLQSGLKGLDRVVPIGKTMDFDFIWDGYNLFERMTRVVNLSF